MDYTVSVADIEGKDPERIQVVLDAFARAVEGGEALIVPIPAGFPMGHVPEIAMRVSHMLRQYKALYEEEDPTELVTATNGSGE